MVLGEKRGRRKVEERSLVTERIGMVVQIGINYIAYFPFSTLQLFKLLNTKFLLKMNQKEEGEGRLDITEEDEGEAGEDFWLGSENS